MQAGTASVSAKEDEHSTSRHSSRTSEPSGRRIDVIDPLRGIAALSVAWFHFTHGSPTYLPEGWLKSSGTYGWMGVEVFFVISGFVLPFSMYAGGYRLRQHWLTFFKKRLTRLEPPYLVSILVALLLIFLSARAPGFHGQQPRLRISDVLQHIAYLNAFTGGDWLNPVYWTLAVEFQFYFAVSLLFPLLVSKDRRISCASLATVALLSLASSNTSLVILYLDIFAFGIATFLFYVGLWPRQRYLVTLGGLVALAWAVHGALIAIVCLSVALIIAYARWKPHGLFVRLGAISYSLYLLHVPIGGRVINLGIRIPYSLSWRLVFLLLAVVVSIAASLLFNRWVERPAQRWSSSIKYEREPGHPIAEAPVPLLPGSAQTEPSL